MATGREILPLAPHSASSLVRRLSRLPVLPPARLAIVNPPITLAQRGVAEGTGTPLLLAAVVGSGIMGDRLGDASQRGMPWCGCLTTSRRRWPVPVWASSSRTRCFRR